MQSRKWYLTVTNYANGNTAHYTVCGYPLLALLDNYIRGAAGRHTIARVTRKPVTAVWSQNLAVVRRLNERRFDECADESRSVLERLL